MKKMLKKHQEKIFILLIVLFTISFYLLTIALNTTYYDNLDYLHLGKNLKNGIYDRNFWLRPIFLPLIISIFYLSGLDLFAITFILPLIFIIAFFILNFYFIKILFNRFLAYIATCFLVTFPALWRWGQYVLVDVPFAVFGILSLILFYLAVEKRKKWYLFYSLIAFSISFLTKISAAAILILFIVYLIYRRKTKLLISKEFLLGVFISFIIILIPIFWVYSSSGPEILRLDILNIAFTSESQEFIFNFLLTPIVIFLPFGLVYMIKRRRKEHILLLMNLLIFLVILYRVGLIRYFTMIYSTVFVFSLFGFFWIKEKIKIKYIFEIILILFLSVTFLNTIYLLKINSDTNYGVKDLSEYVEKNLDGIVSTGSLAPYLDIYTAKNIKQFPHYAEINHAEMDYDEYYNIILRDKSHPLNSLYSEYTIKGNIKEYYKFNDSWVKNNNVSYVILSIYDEFRILPVEKYYNIFYGGIELPIKRPYLSVRPPEDYQFDSEFYKHIDSSGMYEKVNEIKKGNQTVFIIYKVII